jgi:hypothetical protein
LLGNNCSQAMSGQYWLNLLVWLRTFVFHSVYYTSIKAMTNQRTDEKIMPLDILFGGELHHEGDITIRAVSALSSEETENVWRIIETGFAAVNSRSAEPQSMTREEFETDASSSDVIKYIATTDKGIVGYLALHTGLETVSWVETEKLREAQETVDPKGWAFYISTIVVPPDIRGTRTVFTLLHGAYSHLRRLDEATGHRSVAFFDCADVNFPGIPHLAERAAQPAPGFEGIPLAIQPIKTEALIRGADGQSILKIDATEVDPAQQVLDRTYYFMLYQQPVSTESLRSVS